MTTTDYQGKKFKGESTLTVVDYLTIEEALQISINNEVFTITMRTPGDDAALIRGLLNSEGIIKNHSFAPEINLEKVDKKSAITKANVVIPQDKLADGYTNSRNLLSVSSCGICGKKELDELASFGSPIAIEEQIPVDLIHDMFDKMQHVQQAFQKSGGSHASAAFDISGRILSSHEDIGRHNAVDKVVGDLILNDKLESAHCITVSGRISYEIIIKTFKARIPILCAVSAPSSLAVDYAKELGITLLAFCRDDRATCYANPSRIYQHQSIIH